MTSSAACWAAFGQVIEREYSNPQLMEVHRLTVDAWAVQHPGDGSRRAVQSVAMHLGRLMVQLEDGTSGLSANAVMLALSANKATLPAVASPIRFTMTVADVRNAVEPQAHRERVREWAASTWQDWSDQHDVVRNWVRRAYVQTR
jgi:hypothetical protein